jgi:hypothetical protein
MEATIVTQDASMQAEAYVKLIGVTGCEIIDIGLGGALAVSLPDDGGVRQSEILVRGNLQTVTPGNDLETTSISDVVEANKRLDRIIIFETEKQPGMKIITEVIRENDDLVDDSDIRIVEQDENIDAETLQEIGVVRSYDETTGEGSNPITSGLSTFSFDNKYDTVGEFIDHLLVDVLTEAGVRKIANSKPVGGNRVLSTRDTIRSNMSGEDIEFIHENADTICQALEAESLPEGIAKTKDADITTSYASFVFTKAVLELSAFIAEEIERFNSDDESSLRIKELDEFEYPSE